MSELSIINHWWDLQHHNCAGNSTVQFWPANVKCMIIEYESLTVVCHHVDIITWIKLLVTSMMMHERAGYSTAFSRSSSRHGKLSMFTKVHVSVSHERTLQSNFELLHVRFEASIRIKLGPHQPRTRLVANVPTTEHRLRTRECIVHSYCCNTVLPP